MRDARRYAVAALERGLTILQTLAVSETPLTLQDVAIRARIAKTTAFRLLATLEGRGFVARTREGTYRVGLRVIQLAQVAGGEVELRRAAQTILQRLHHTSEDTVNLAKWHDRQIVYLDVLPSPRPLRFVEVPGSLAPMHATALGKAIAAFLPEELVIDVLRQAGMPRFTPYTITTPARFLKEIRRVRLRGFAVDRQETDLGAACIAAPVFDAQGIAAAVSLSAPVARMDARRIQDLAPVLIDACAALSRQLGHRLPRRFPAARTGARKARAHRDEST